MPCVIGVRALRTASRQCIGSCDENEVGSTGIDEMPSLPPKPPEPRRQHRRCALSTIGAPGPNEHKGDGGGWGKVSLRASSEIKGGAASHPPTH